MIDPADRQTQPLPLGEQPAKKRGRPATGRALSNADRQRAYRERQKRNVTELERERDNAYATSCVDESYSESLWEEMESAKARIAELEAQLATVKGDLVIANAKLAQRNEKPQKTYVAALQRLSPKGQWRTVTKFETQQEAALQIIERHEGEMGHLYRLKNLK